MPDETKRAKLQAVQDKEKKQEQLFPKLPAAPPKTNNKKKNAPKVTQPVQNAWNVPTVQPTPVIPTTTTSYTTTTTTTTATAKTTEKPKAEKPKADKPAAKVPEKPVTTTAPAKNTKQDANLLSCSECGEQVPLKDWDKHTKNHVKQKAQAEELIKQQKLQEEQRKQEEIRKKQEEEKK